MGIIKSEPRRQHDPREPVKPPVLNLCQVSKVVFLSAWAFPYPVERC